MSDNGLRAFESVVGLVKSLAVCATVAVIGVMLCRSLADVCDEVRQAKEEITAIKNRLQNPFGG